MQRFGSAVLAASIDPPAVPTPIPVLRTLFRKKFLDGLRHLHRKGQLDCRGPAADFSDLAWFEELITNLGKKKWFVYAKPPFGGPSHVLRYLGRYTHRMAISNHRLLAFDGQTVSFRWRDYAHGSKQRIMTLDAEEFLRRFFLHVLPKGFVRIRHYGLLANRFRNRFLPLAHTLLAADGRQQLPLPPCRTATSGTVPDAEKPCGSSSASPPHNSISQVSIPHDRLCQSAQPACSTHVFAGVCTQHAEQLQDRVQRHPRTARLQTAHATAHRLPSPSATMAAPESIYPITKPLSISIIPTYITATAPPAASSLPSNRKRLATKSPHQSRFLREALPMLTSGNTAATRLQVLLNANFLIRFGPQHLVRKVKYWEYNHGDGLNAEDSLELAKWLREDLASGAVKEYERSHHEYMAALPKVECPMCNGTGVRKDSIAVMYGFPDKIVESEGPWKGERGWCHVCDGHGERECDANGLRVFRAERSRIRYVPRRQRRF